MDKKEKKKAKRIEKFKGLCNMEQKDLKAKLRNILGTEGYKEVKNEDGFLYAKGEVPVLLIAHMDTVHKILPTFFSLACSNGKTVLSSPFGIGGDDRCGVYMILEIIRELKCSVLFCEDEEKGCVGARKFADTDYVKNLDVNYIIEFDRRGKNDAVFYRCGNEEFEAFVTAEFFETDFGSCSDISHVAPAAGIAAVNLSCGYYNEHTKGEYVVFEEMETVIEEAKKLIQTEVEEPFEYIAKKSAWDYSWGHGWYDDDDYWKSPVVYKGQRRILQKYLFYYFDESDDEQWVIVRGYNRDDAILDFLKENDMIPYSNIVYVYDEDELEKIGVYV